MTYRICKINHTCLHIMTNKFDFDSSNKNQPVKCFYSKTKPKKTFERRFVL